MAPPKVALYAPLCLRPRMMMAESVTDSWRQSCPTPAPASEPAPAPALYLVAAVDEDSGVAERQLALAEHSIAHPNDFLKPKGVHPKSGSGVVPPHESPLQRLVCIGLVLLEEQMIGGEVARDVAGPDLD
eukprot:1232814-Rhodomonas_salina.1